MARGAVVRRAGIGLRQAVLAAQGAIEVRGGGAASIRGAVFEPRAGQAITVDATSSNGDGNLMLTDATVRGRGMAAGVVGRHGDVVLTRVLIDAPLGHGVRVEEATATLEAVRIRNVRPFEGGAGIDVGAAGEIDATRLAIRGSAVPGVLMAGEGAFLDLDVRGDDAAAASTGAGAELRNATVTLRRFLIDSAGLCGLRLVGATELTAEGGVLSNNERGLCVRGSDPSVASVTTPITYAGNRRNIVVEQ